MSMIASILILLLYPLRNAFSPPHAWLLFPLDSRPRLRELLETWHLYYLWTPCPVPQEGLCERLSV